MPPLISQPSKRQRLYDVAAHQFAARGYEGTSFGSIADEMGTSRGSIQHYIGSKAELAAEILWHPLNTGCVPWKAHDFVDARTFLLAVADGYSQREDVRASLRLSRERTSLPFEAPDIAAEWCAHGAEPLAVPVADLTAEDIVAIALGLLAAADFSGAFGELRARARRLVDALRLP